MQTPRIPALIAAFIASATLAFAGEPIDLLASRDLADWNHVLADENVAKEDVWSFNDAGHLVCKGVPKGFLATKENYRNFIFEVEWRWPERPTNSGVLMRITSDHPVPACIEAQLAHGAAGKIMGLKGTMVDGETAATNARGTMTVLSKTAGREVRPGEWNHYKITAKDGVIVLELNGVEANRTTDADTTAGPIALQSEGGPIEFRNVRLTPLD